MFQRHKNTFQNKNLVSLSTDAENSKDLKAESVSLEEKYPPAHTGKNTSAVAGLTVRPLLEPIVFQSITGTEGRIKNKLNPLNTEVEDSCINTVI